MKNEDDMFAGVTWNYRVMKDEQGRYGMYEVFYDSNGKVVSWTANPRTGHYEAPEEIREDLDLMLQSLDQRAKNNDLILDMMDYPNKE